MHVPPSQARRIVNTGILPVLATGTVSWMALDWQQDPFDSTNTGTLAYGHNHDGALEMGLGLVTVELLVLLVILRPWSYNRNWERTLLALALLAPCVLTSGVLCLHAGGILIIHLLWVLGVSALMLAHGVMLLGKNWLGPSHNR